MQAIQNEFSAGDGHWIIYRGSESDVAKHARRMTAAGYTCSSRPVDGEHELKCHQDANRVLKYLERINSPQLDFYAARYNETLVTEAIDASLDVLAARYHIFE